MKDSNVVSITKNIGNPVRLEVLGEEDLDRKEEGPDDEELEQLVHEIVYHEDDHTELAIEGVL